MKLATARNGKLIYKAKVLPKRAKINASVWAILKGESKVIRIDFAPTELVFVREFLQLENILALIDKFLDETGITDGDLVESYGIDVYKWR